MSEMKVYLDGKELGNAPEDMEVSLNDVKMEHETYRPKNFECEITLNIWYGMEYVDEMRRRRWCNSFRHGGQKQ